MNAPGKETKEGKESKESKETKETEAAAKQPVEQEGITRRGGQRGGLAQRRSSWRGFPDLPLALTNPFELMRRLMEDIGTVGGVSPSLWTPSVDVFERDNQLVVRADLPGLKKGDVRVEV